MSKFDRKKIAATLAFTSIFSGKSQAMETKSPQTLAAVGGEAAIAQKNLPVSKGCSKGAKIGITAASIFLIGTAAALITWGVRNKSNKGPEDTGLDAERQENRNILDFGKNEYQQSIITENKIMKDESEKEKIVEKKQEQSKFFKVLQKTFDSEENKFVYQRIKTILLDLGDDVFLPWTPADVFKKMFEAIADENSEFSKYYYFKNKTYNGEYEKLIDMISGKVEFEDIQVKEVARALGFKDYCLTIYKERMKEWMKFTISSANFFNNDSIADMEIQLCERLGKGSKAVKKCNVINISSIMNERKFKVIDYN